MNDPQLVECPQCLAQPGQPCISGTRRGRALTRGYHNPRKQRALGRYVETFDYRLRKALSEAVRKSAEKSRV